MERINYANILHEGKRSDILMGILNGCSFQEIITYYETPREKGFVYETISIIVLIGKELIKNYSSISDTKLTEKDLIFSYIENSCELVDKPISQGNNLSDITLVIDDKIVPFSVKYRDKKGRSDLIDCENCMKKYCESNNREYSLGFIVK